MGIIVEVGLDGCLRKDILETLHFLFLSESN